MGKPDPNNEPYPVTIVTARYSGLYEGGRWLAWPLDPGTLPTGWDGDDSECAFFWSTYEEPVGKGATPAAALAALKRALA